MKAIARHEITITIDDIVGIAKSILKTGGKFITIYPAWRLIDLLTCMRGRGIEPKKLRLIHSRLGDQARLVIAEGIKGGRPGLAAEHPIYIYQQEDVYSDEVESPVGVVVIYDQYAAGLRHHSSLGVGRVMVMVVPVPVRLSTAMLPPWAWTMLWTMARPNPVPLLLVEK